MKAWPSLSKGVLLLLVWIALIGSLGCGIVDHVTDPCMVERTDLARAQAARDSLIRQRVDRSAANYLNAVARFVSAQSNLVKCEQRVASAR